MTPAEAADLSDLVLTDCVEPNRTDRSQSLAPTPLWGSIDCQTSSRHARLSGGGDHHATASGADQGDDQYRRLTVRDGDDVYGERCELGLNDHRFNTFQLYREGERWITFLSIRLPTSFPLSTSRWQTVAQMKQAQPSANGGGGPILEVQAMAGKWWLVNDWNEIWSTPAQKGVWTRIALDVHYSQHPGQGTIKMYVDRNGDGDAADAGEVSPTMHVPTLKRETAGGWEPNDGIAPGDSIPSHLRAGIYHDPQINCPGTEGCAVELDNVQTVRVG